MDLKRAGLILVVVTFLILSVSSFVSASEKGYPNRPIQIIITYAPGGPLDTSVRLIHPTLQSILGVPVILENKAGAAGALGADYVAKAKPDGYTIAAFCHLTLGITPYFNTSVTYKPSDFIPICTFTADPSLISSKPGVPWKTLEELIEYAKKNPGKLNYGSTGFGSLNYMVMELFKFHYGLDIVPVHFQGTGPVKNAILGGHVDLAITGFSNMISLIKAEKIIPMLITTKKRLDDFPDIPTFLEKGFSEEASFSIWNGLFVSRNCPRPVVDKLVWAMEKTMKDPATITQIEKAGLIVDYRDTASTLKLLEYHSSAAKKVVEKLKLTK